MSNFESLPLDAIIVGDRLRQLNRDKVEVLKQSITRIGLKVPISVRYVSDEYGCDLVAGLHRLEACRELGWEEIPVREETGSADDARMWEIAENLHRAELTELEQSNHIAEWIRLCEAWDKPAQLAPVSTKGGRGHEGGVRAAARDLGIERTEAQRAVKIDALAPKARAEARTLGLDNNQSALLKAANQPDAEAQINSLREHAAARAARKAKPKPAATPAPQPASAVKLSPEAMADLGARCAVAMGREPAADPVEDIAAARTALTEDQRAMIVAGVELDHNPPKGVAETYREQRKAEADRTYPEEVEVVLSGYDKLSPKHKKLFRLGLFARYEW
jgi:ParB-like chromosome segregation protein Spo0J